MERMATLLYKLTDRPDLFIGYLKGLNSFISGPGVVWCLRPWSETVPENIVVNLHLQTSRIVDWHTLLTEQHGFSSDNYHVYKRGDCSICIFPSHMDNLYDELENAPTTLDTISYNGNEIFGKCLEDARDQRVGHVMDETKLTIPMQIYWSSNFELIDKDN